MITLIKTSLIMFIIAVAPACSTLSMFPPIGHRSPVAALTDLDNTNAICEDDNVDFMSDYDRLNTEEFCYNKYKTLIREHGNISALIKRSYYGAADALEYLADHRDEAEKEDATKLAIYSKMTNIQMRNEISELRDRASKLNDELLNSATDHDNSFNGHLRR